MSPAPVDRRSRTALPPLVRPSLPRPARRRTAALAGRALLEDVVRHKKVFFNASYADYGDCLDGRLRLIPDEDQLGGLRSDYDAMRRAGIVGADAPAFDTLIEQLRALETEANRPA